MSRENKKLMDELIKIGALYKMSCLIDSAKELSDSWNWSHIHFKNGQEVTDWLKANEKKIDVEKMILMILSHETQMTFKDKEELILLTPYANVYRSLVDLAKVQFIEQFMKERKETFVSLLKKSKVEVPLIKEKNGIQEIEKFQTINDFLGKQISTVREDKLKAKNEKILDEIDEKIGLRNIVNYLDLKDYSEFICYYPGNGISFMNVALHNVGTIIIHNKKTDDKAAYNEALKNEQIKFLKKFPEKFDMEKLLLIAAYRTKLYLEPNDKFSNYNLLIKIMQSANEIIKNEELKIVGNISKDDSDAKYHVMYTARELSKDVSRIIDGLYFPAYKLKLLKQKVMTEGLDVTILENKELFDLFEFTNTEKERLVEANPSNLQTLFTFEAVNNAQIRRMLYRIRDFKFDYSFLQDIYKLGTIKKEDFVSLYMRSNINLTDISDFDEKYDLTENINAAQLMNYYFEMKQDSEKAKDYDRYLLLFKKIALKDKEKQSDISEKIMEELYKTDRDYSEDLVNLYTDGVLPIMSLIEWNGEEMIYKLINKNSLKPQDAKELLLSGILDVEKTYQTLKKSNLSSSEKMNFIYTSFNGLAENETEADIQNKVCERLVQVIDVSNNIEKSEFSHGRQIHLKSILKRNRYISDPRYRWQLFAQLDENYTSEVYADGTTIFTYPDLNNGMVIIEKMLKNTQFGVRPDYCVATYMMDLETFYSHKSEIVEKQSISRKVLIRMNQNNENQKLVHSESWGEKLKQSIGVSIENTEKIDELIKRIDASRTLID